MPDKRVTVWVQHFKDRASLVLQWIDPDTRRRKSQSAQTTNPTVAEKAREKLQYELNNGLYQEPSKVQWPRFRELFEREYLPNCRSKTQKLIGSVLDDFEDICQPKQVRSITERTISQYAAGSRQRPGRGNTFMAPYTVKVRLAYLHICLAWGVGQNLLQKCPTFPKVKVPQKSPQPIPVESFERLQSKARDDNMRAYLLCGWLAGLRLAEALTLEWEETNKAPWLDLVHNRIVLPAEFVKGAKDQWVPLDPLLRHALEALPRAGRKVFRFVTKRGRPITEMGVSRRVTALAKRAGVRMSMKSLRKGFGCYYAARVSAHVLQKLMRHVNIKTTMDYYANVDTAVEEAVLARNGMLVPTERNTLCNSLENQGDLPNHGEDGSLSSGRS